jgi:hypothetical protein
MSVPSPNITMKPEPRPSLLHRIPDVTVKSSSDDIPADTASTARSSRCTCTTKGRLNAACCRIGPLFRLDQGVERGRLSRSVIGCYLQSRKVAVVTRSGRIRRQGTTPDAGRKPGHAADIPESAGYPDRPAANPSRIARHLAARITRTGYLAGTRKRNFPRKEPDTPAQGELLPPRPSLLAERCHS